MDQNEIDEIIKCISEQRLSKFKKESELYAYVEIILKSQKIYPALHRCTVRIRTFLGNEINHVRNYLENLDSLFQLQYHLSNLCQLFSNLLKLQCINLQLSFLHMCQK